MPDTVNMTVRLPKFIHKKLTNLVHKKNKNKPYNEKTSINKELIKAAEFLASKQATG